MKRFFYSYCFTNIVWFIVCTFVFTTMVYAQSFKIKQSGYSRVKNATTEKELVLKSLFITKNLVYPPSKMFIRIFKQEKELEVWIKNKNNHNFTLLKTYEICSSSGKLGPKRKQGDFQVPEGFYYIDTFNPSSNFHLSVRINYPNVSDRILGIKDYLGGDICIHGNCVTIGCIPITDDNIKEVYLLAVEAYSGGQKEIPVHIFPMRMNTGNTTSLQEYAKNDSMLMYFWENIRLGYEYFEKYHLVPKITVTQYGKYVFPKK